MYPLAGPIFIEGAEPGDILEVDMLRLEPLRWGWARLITGLGLLANTFTQPYIRHFDLTNRVTALSKGEGLSRDRERVSPDRTLERTG